MNRPMSTLATVIILCLGIAVPYIVVAQSAEDHVGTWTLISSDTVSPDGKKAPTFGGPATGTLFFRQ